MAKPPKVHLRDSGPAMQMPSQAMRCFSPYCDVAECPARL